MRLISLIGAIFIQPRVFWGLTTSGTPNNPSGVHHAQRDHWAILPNYLIELNARATGAIALLKY